MWCAILNATQLILIGLILAKFGVLSWLYTRRRS
jgi:hypothetical protein